MGVRRAILACLVTSALTVTGAGVSAAAVPATPDIPSMVEPPGALAPAVTEPLNPGTTESLALSGDDLPPASGPDGHLSGHRKAAQMVTRDLSDATKLGWNPTTGNIVLTGKLLHLEGADRDIDLSWRYNSINDHGPTLSEGTIETALTVGADNSVTYTAADGGTYKFEPKTGGGWTMPPGLNASITAFSATAITLRFNDSGETNFYQNVNGVYRLTHTGHHYSATADRNVYAYDTDGRLASITTPNGRQVTFEYLDVNNDFQPSNITDQTLGRTILINYRADQSMGSITDATGAEINFGYNSADLITSIRDGRDGSTELDYNSDGTAKEIIYAADTGAETVHALTPVDATTSHLTDGAGRTTVFTFNASRQVTQVTDPLGHTSKKTYNNHDDVLTDTDSLGNLTTSTYNPNNTLKNVTSPAGATGGTGKQVSYTYPAATAGEAWLEFQPLSSTDSEGNTTSFTYDSVTQRPYQTVTPSGQGGTLVNRYQGDAAGTSCGALRGQLCKTIDGKGNTTSITYNASRNPVTITRPAPLGAVTNTFDAAGRIATSKDGKNQTATYAYDGFDRLKQIRYSPTCAPADCVTYSYDANGNLTGRTDAAGTTTIAYDQQNRPTSKTVDGVTTSATYDQASNITSYTDPTGTVDYRYDDDDRLIALAEPGGSCPATPVFPNSTKCTGFTYDNNDRRTATSYPNGVKNTTAYDKAARTTSITATNTAGTVLAKRAYTYTVGATGKDGALRKSMTDETGAVTTYGYDKMARLTSAASGTVTDSWTYDANGNRLTAAKTGTATTHYAYNAADQLCWTGSAAGTCAAPPAGAALYTYDANGNNTKAGTPTSIWNTFNQMTSHTRSTTAVPFTYAGPSNTERTSAGSTTFVNGLLGLTRQTSGTSTTSFVREPDGTLISMTNSAGTFYYTTDALKSTIALTDSTQAKAATYTYDAWGKTTGTGTQAGNNRFQYIGEYKDAATALNKFGARYYDANTGRFTQPDPSGQEPNRYAYAQCNPTNQTDPSGLAPADTCVQSHITDEFFGGLVFGALTGAVLGASGGIVAGPAGGLAGAIGGAVIGGVVGGTTKALKAVATGNVGCRVSGLEWTLNL
jgi:RHS repeat-associated protein